MTVCRSARVRGPHGARRLACGRQRYDTGRAEAGAHHVDLCSYGDGSEAGDGSSGTFAQESPWRLRVSGVDVVGCDVMVTNDDSGNVHNWEDVCGTKTFQMRESG